MESGQEPSAPVETEQQDLTDVSHDQVNNDNSTGALNKSQSANSSNVVQSSDKNKNLQWYAVHAYSGFEMKAKKTLEDRVKAHGMSEQFGEILVPQETVVELVKGQKKTSSKKFFPGYLLVQMVLNRDTWHLVNETPKISGFLGDATDPDPVPQEEVSRILAQVEEGTSAPRSKVSFEQGEPVKVIDGPFADFNGTIDEVRPEKEKVRVLISIFGRATPVELNFSQVEKL